MTTATLTPSSNISPTEPPVQAEPAQQVETRFGPIPLDSKRQITFQGGLPGFPDYEVYQLDQPAGVDTELLLLQALGTSNVGFFVMSANQPGTILHSEDIAAASRHLDIDAENLLILLIVTFKKVEDSVEKYVNLRAPIFVDVENRTGTQLIMQNADYPLRFQLN